MGHDNAIGESLKRRSRELVVQTYANAYLAEDLEAERNMNRWLHNQMQGLVPELDRCRDALERYRLVLQRVITFEEARVEQGVGSPWLVESLNKVLDEEATSD